MNKTGIRHLANHLQVTIEEKSRIYNLEPEKPVVVNEIDEMHELFDPERFVETGFKLVVLKMFETVTSSHLGFMCKSLSTSPLNNLVIETRDNQHFRIYRRYTSNDIAVTLKEKKF